MSASNNLFAQWQAMFATGPLQVGVVVAIDGGVATIDLPSGARMRARGAASVGAYVYVQDGVIQGIAPSLPLDSSEV